ncbi:hypothetical protein ACUIJN_14595 [Metabacillus halosaccharovorans]
MQTSEIFSEVDYFSFKINFVELMKSVISLANIVLFGKNSKLRLFILLLY